MTTVKFAGINLSKFLKVNRVHRSIGNSREIEKDNSPLIGVNIHAVNTAEKIIKIDFTLLQSSPQEIEQAKHEVAGLFSKGEPQRLEISDEPDKYYLAIVVGDVSLEAITRWFQRGTVEFLIPDGVAHSTTYKRFINPIEEGSKLIFDLENNGNVPAQPIITIKHNAENGYIGIVNQTNALEIGDREEADTEAYKRSEILFDYISNDGIITGLSKGQKNAAILNDLGQNLNGTLSIVNEWNRPHLTLSNRGSGSRPNHAGSITWEIPLDSSRDRGALNEYFYWRQIFWAGSVLQKGFIKIAVSDTEGRFLYGVETIKRGNGIDTEYNLLVSDGKGGFKILNTWNFKCTHAGGENPFNAEGGHSDILRRDDMLQVHWWGSYPQYHVPEIKGRKSAKIHVALGAFGDQPQVHHMYLDGLVYRKDFVTGVLDVPNRFQIGSQVVLDVEKDLVTIDGLSANHQVVDGSGWGLSIPSGKSQLEVLFSSWCKTKPTVTINFEERYL